MERFWTQGPKKVSREGAKKTRSREACLFLRLCAELIAIEKKLQLRLCVKSTAFSNVQRFLIFDF